MTNRLKQLDLIGYDCGWGARNGGCQDGPAALGIDALGAKGLADRATMTHKSATLPYLLESLDRLHNRVRASLAQGALPVVIGGDHTSAIATWSAVASFYDIAQSLGLIWIDAHMDAHTPQTAHEGKWGGWWHGMPVASLMGAGMTEFTTLGGLGPKLSPAHLCQIGIRSFEPGEELFLRSRGARIYDMNDVREHGFAAILEQTLHRLSQTTERFGVSIDMDSFDPADAPGVGSPEPGGLSADEVLAALALLGDYPGLCAVEIVEYNPGNDLAGKTARLVHDLIDRLPGLKRAS